MTKNKNKKKHGCFNSHHHNKNKYILKKIIIIIANIQQQ